MYYVLYGLTPCASMGKRRNSSDGGKSNSTNQKLSKVVISPKGMDGHKDEQLGVSDILSEASSVLYADQCNEYEMIPCQQGNPKGNPSVGQNTGTCTPQLTSLKDSPVPSNLDIMKYLTKLDGKLTDMGDRLTKLDTLETKVNSFEAELKKLWVHIDDKYRKSEDRVRAVEGQVDGIAFDVGVAQDKMTQIEQDHNKFKESLTYLQSQSMRNNLIFSGIAELPSERPEDTEKLIRDFICEKLHVARATVNQLKLERAHRMGPISSNYTRKIVCKFNLFPEREMVRKLSNKLKGTTFYINEQFPADVVEKRKRLQPRLKRAKESGQRAWISYDTLFIDGKPVRETT